MFLTLVLGSLLVLLLFSKIVYKQYKIGRKLKGFVSPPGLPVLRHFPLFTSEFTILQNLIDLSKKYGERIKLELFYGVPVLLTSDKDLVFHMLNTVLLKDNFYENCERWLGEGIITCKPDKWKRSRKMLNPAFTIQALEGYLKSFENSANVLIKRLKAEVGNEGFDISPYMTLCTLDIIYEVVMGFTLNVQENRSTQYTEDVHEITAIVVRRLFSPLKRHPLTYRLTKDYRRELGIVERIRNLTQTVIDDKRRIKAEATTNGANGRLVNGIIEKSKNESILDILLEAEIDGRPLTDKELVDETQSFIFAGHDTSATCISLCLYCLSKHPDIQTKVVKELESIFGKDARSPTLKDLNEMRYLEMVIKETMRFYTPVPFMSRPVAEDVNLDGVSIPKGLSIILFLRGIHMNPKYYPNPEKFDPSRFEEDVKLHAFLPFGAGPRQCIGQRFAMLEIKYLVHHILRNFKILEVTGHVPKQGVFILLKFQNGTMIRLEHK